MAVSPTVPLTNIDDIVSAEVPTSSGRYQDLVRSLMVHNHSSRCGGVTNPSACCWKFPKPLRDFTTLDNHGKVLHRRRKYEDRFVVPHNKYLLELLECHINFEISSNVSVFAYSMKYLFKGNKFF